MRKALLFACLLALPLGAAQQTPAPSPEPLLPPGPAVPPAGKTIEGVYVNDDAGLRVPIPPGWSLQERRDRGMLDLLLSPPEGAPPAAEELTLIDTSVHTQLASGHIARRQDSSRDLQPNLAKEGVTLGGISFDRTNYREKNPGAMPQQTRLSAVVKGWRLLIIIDAASEGDIKNLTDSLTSLQFAPTHQTASKPPAVVHMAGGVTQGFLVHKVQPHYPDLAKANKITGTVVLKAIIGKDGKIKDLKPIEGHPVLIPAAMETVRQWEYRPYLLNGLPVEVETAITVNFTLNRFP